MLLRFDKFLLNRVLFTPESREFLSLSSSDRLSAEFASARTGKEADILVEKIEEKDGKMVAEGYTANYIRTFADVEGKDLSRGDIIGGVISGSENETCLMKIN